MAKTAKLKTVEVHFDQRIGMVLCTVKVKGRSVPMGDAFAKTREEAQARALNIANVTNYGDGSGVAYRFGHGLTAGELLTISGAAS